MTHFPVLTFAGFLFVQQVYEFDLINPADIPHTYKQKGNAKEQACNKHGIRVKTEMEFGRRRDRPHDKCCHDPGQERSEDTPTDNGSHAEKKGFSEEVLCDGALLHAEDHINGKFPAALFQHVAVDISDQCKKNNGNCKYGISDRVLEQGQRVVSVPAQNVVVPARQGQKSKKQGTAYYKGKKVDHIVL